MRLENNRTSERIDNYVHHEICGESKKPVSQDGAESPVQGHLEGSRKLHHFLAAKLAFSKPIRVIGWPLIRRPLQSDSTLRSAPDRICQRAYAAVPTC